MTWLAPLIVTALSAAWATWVTFRADPGHLMMGTTFAAVFAYGFATVVSLIAWLVWAVLT